MKHLKAANRKARAVEAARTGGDVVGMVQPMGCTTIFNPGWEADPWGGAHAMCSPTEADLAGCSGVCWWPAQVPDIGTYPEWSAGKPSAQNDWRDLDAVFPTK